MGFGFKGKLIREILEIKAKALQYGSVLTNLALEEHF